MAGLFADLLPTDEPPPGIFDDLIPQGPVKKPVTITPPPMAPRDALPEPPMPPVKPEPMRIMARPEGQRSVAGFEPDPVRRAFRADPEKVIDAVGMMFPAGGAEKVAAEAVPGAARKLLTSRPVVSASLAGSGLALQQSDDEKIKATGTGLMLLGGMHAIGVPVLKAGASKVGTAIVDAVKNSPTGAKMLNLISHDILADPKVKAVVGAYEDAVSKGRARAAELSSAAKKFGPSGDRTVSDIIERETFEPLTPDQTTAIAVAQRISDEFTALGRAKVGAGLLSAETVAKREGRYLPRMYAEHLGEQATAGTPPVLKGTTGVKPRISTEQARQELSPEIRNTLGEVREASFRTAYGIEKGTRSVAASHLFESLREMPGVLHPEYTGAVDALKAAYQSGDQAAVAAAKKAVAGTTAALEKTAGYTKLPDTPALGVLRNAIVRNDVAGYLNGIPSLGGKVGDLYQQWKRIHTVLNPGTHVGNTMSNSVVAHMAGLSIPEQVIALPKALKDYNAYGPSTKYLAELGVLERGLPTYSEGVAAGGKKLSRTLTELSETTRPETQAVLAEKGITPRGPIRKAISAGAEKMERAYSKEDGVFRVAVFDKLVRGGMEPRAAADYVDKAFVNYRTRSPLLGAIKNTVSPFVLYPAKAIPFVAGQIIEHPWRWATLAALWGGLDQYSQQQVGKIAQEDLRPDQRTNKALGYLSPGFTQLPMTNKRGDKYGLDLARWTPFSALTGAPAPGSMAFAMGGSSVPGIVQPSGPFIDVGARLTNTDPFTGDKLIKPGDDARDIGGSVVQSLASLALPSAVSFHAPRVVRDIRNADPKAAAVDALGLIGARPQVVRPGMQRVREVHDFEDARSNIIAELRRDLRAAKSPERQAALRERATAKLRALAAKFRSP